MLNKSSICVCESDSIKVELGFLLKSNICPPGFHIKLTSIQKSITEKWREYDPLIDTLAFENYENIVF